MFKSHSAIKNRTVFSVVCSVDTLLKRVNRANLPVFDVKKVGNRLQFAVDDDNVKKVFAIFNKPCYNTVIINQSKRIKLLSFIKTRFGVIVGSLLFLVVRAIADCAVLRIDVVGTGDYLKNQVVHVLDCHGVKLFRTVDGVDFAVIRSEIMSLPSVTFCDVVKRGSTLVVNVQTDEENSATVQGGNLVSDRAGKIIKIVAVSGTPLKRVGDCVEKGDDVIGAYCISADGSVLPCKAVGYAEIECYGVASFSATGKTQENDAIAAKIPLLYSERVLNYDFSVKGDSQGVIYEVNFSYIHTIKINLE